MRTSWIMIAALAFFPGLCAAPGHDTAGPKLKQELFTEDARWAGLEVYVEIPFRDTASAVVFLKGPVRSVADRN